ncbi:hypothetical protein H5392_01385 [Tessaracoccus sp. MC1865]|uniref:hypothetical protein n=1 Tax=Tessaracoccus sp. MC1865 TaxID=2760310 RepID=UPI0016035A9D|nr:hypothetical protein [Tessaracoccus sp. MC1865]MBB1482510.1 hypothetical protein [Tessaracoccus sp. MC1865]QTO38035.1 hypothetical protein J7D54_02705 [Tessaracoccus sp. MC1865]
MRDEQTRNEMIGRTVAAWRGDMSQKALADEMRALGHKWSQSTVWSVESGSRPLKLVEAVDLARTLREDGAGFFAVAWLADPTGRHRMVALRDAQKAREKAEDAILDYLKKRYLAAGWVESFLDNREQHRYGMSPAVLFEVAEILSDRGDISALGERALEQWHRVHLLDEDPEDDSVLQREISDLIRDRLELVKTVWERWTKEVIEAFPRKEPHGEHPEET